MMHFVRRKDEHTAIAARCQPTAPQPARQVRSESRARHPQCHSARRRLRRVWFIDTGHRVIAIGVVRQSHFVTAVERQSTTENKHILFQI